MAKDFVYSLDPASFITIGTLGPPGARTFYLQGTQGNTIVSLIIEKEQARALSLHLERLLDALDVHYPRERESVSEVTYDMALIQPVNPLWRVGQMRIGYDDRRDLIILIAEELVFEDEEPDDPERVQITGSREQMHALCKHVAWLVEQGRPTCPLCGNPINPDGHFCPQSNGHRKPVEL
jgi:uncharacterized repeat protein (TIGR03847 family)